MQTALWGTHFTFKLLTATTYTLLARMALDNKIKLLTMYNVWSWSSRLTTACLNRRTKSLKVSQCTGQVCSVSEEELCNWMRISSRRSRDVKYSTQFTNTWGSWREEEKWYNCIWLFQCKYSRNSFLFHMRERKKPYPANRIYSKTKKKLVKKKRINYVPSQNIMYHKLKRELMNVQMEQSTF